MLIQWIAAQTFDSPFSLDAKASIAPVLANSRIEDRMWKELCRSKNHKLTGLIGEPQAVKNYQLGNSKDLQHKPPNIVKTLHRHKDLPKLDSSHSSIYSMSLNVSQNDRMYSTWSDCPLQTG